MYTEEEENKINKLCKTQNDYALFCTQKGIPHLHSKVTVTFKRAWSKLYYTQHIFLSNMGQLPIHLWVSNYDNILIFNSDNDEYGVILSWGLTFFILIS